MDNPQDSKETKRLEELWAGKFGQDYVERNRAAANGRDAFWKPFLERHPVREVLEVGCNIGANVRWIAAVLPPANVHGIDVNVEALQSLSVAVPGVQVARAAARHLPYGDARFDLVFTAGVLIHQPEEALAQVMSEIVRCSRRYVLAIEYFSLQTQEVFYRGQEGALFKRDYGRLYRERHPELKEVETGRLGRPEGWDDVTYWLFTKGG